MVDEWLYSHHNLPRKIGQDTSPLLRHRPQAPALVPRHRWRPAIKGRGTQVIATFKDVSKKHVEKHDLIEGMSHPYPSMTSQLQHNPDIFRQNKHHLAWGLDAHVSPLSPVCDSGDTCTAPETGTWYDGMIMESSNGKVIYPIWQVVHVHISLVQRPPVFQGTYFKLDPRHVWLNMGAKNKTMGSQCLTCFHVLTSFSQSRFSGDLWGTPCEPEAPTAPPTAPAASRKPSRTSKGGPLGIV